MVSQKIVTSFEMLTPRGWSVIGYRAVAVFFFFFSKIGAEISRLRSGLRNW